MSRLNFIGRTPPMGPASRWFLRKKAGFVPFTHNSTKSLWITCGIVPKSCGYNCEFVDNSVDNPVENLFF